ncbi:methyl-accepting chemotaxis protein [Paramagnetospirillum kuznetsovii]|uniref:Methyl-accepting chemotaxis protein n=1 Tax=Paramagnetospirillum kuznetsovii TaxID=2053833 RepID=A0A364NXI3_9PROT|nr:methyl-accepting chemotaxis protein [Paramagnetospirillum kuznetsovii]RAU21617.1 methyl-accepting chemotaxis protein [Paramagnetospirillum kuznetsovii]
MTNANTHSLWKTMKLRRKFSSVSVAFTLVLAGLIVFNVMVLRSQSQYSVVTDMVGRQRMLSQKFAKEVLLVGNGAVADHQATLRLMRDSLAVLMEGGEIILNLDTQAKGELPPAPSAEIRAKLAEQAVALRLYEQAATTYLGMSAADPKRADRLRELLIAQTQVSDLAEGAVKMLSYHASSAIQSMIWLQVVISIIIGFLGMAISRQIGRQISEPLEACSEAARKVADGDLRIDDLEVNSMDEIGVLQVAFNQMVHSQRDVASQARSACDSLIAAAAAILSSAQEQAAGTKQQAAAVQEITTTVEEISLSGKQVAERSRQVAGTAEAVATSGATGLQAVRDASVGMEAIREQTETVAENIITLSERTQAVGEIIATVNEIAEQSNLVALNAAIEAADAREQGRRFSVVANEIKNLADQAKEATSQVRGILEQTQKGINTSVMLTEEALKRVESGRERTTQSEHVIRQMSDNIQESVHAFQQIVGATNQQQIGLEQVTQALHEIRQASQQTAVTTAQLEKASLDLGQLGQALAHTLEKYRL